MNRFVKPLLVAALAAVGVLAFSAGSAKAQVPVYGQAYATPYTAAGVGIGTFYNAVNGVPTPFLPSYAPYGSYYNYANRAVVPYVVYTAPVYGGNYRHGHYSHHRHWHW